MKFAHKLMELETTILCVVTHSVRQSMSVFSVFEHYI